MFPNALSSYFSMNKVNQDTTKTLFQKWLGSVWVSVSDQGTSPSYQKVIW